MQPQTPQPQVPEHNQTMANLGFINTMQEHLLQHKGKQKALQEAPQMPQNAPQPTPQPNPQEDMQSMETRLMGEIKGLKDTIEKNKPKDKNKELEDLKKQIEDVLKEND